MNNAITPEKKKSGKKKSSHMVVKTAAITLAVLLLLFLAISCVTYILLKSAYADYIYDDSIKTVAFESPNVLPEWSELRPVLLSVKVTKAVTQFNVLNTEPAKEQYTKDITVIGVYLIKGELVEHHLTGYTVDVEKNMLTTPGDKTVTVRYTEYYGENIPTASAKVTIPVKVLQDGSANPESPFALTVTANTYMGYSGLSNWKTNYLDDYNKIVGENYDPIYQLDQKNPNIFNVLLIGTAKNDAEPTLSRNKMETAMIVSYNIEKGSISLLSVHTTTLGVIGNKVYPLSGVYAIGGAGAVINSVNTLLGTDIQHYIEVDLDSFLGYVDSLGGVKVNLTRDDIENLDLIGVSAGEALISGENAEKYLTDNGTEAEGIEKTARQRRFMLALMKKVLSGTNIFNIRSKVSEVDFVKTNLPFNVALSYMFTTGFDIDDTIFFNNFAPYGSYGESYSFVVYSDKYRMYYADPDNLKIMTDTLLGYSK